MSTPWWKSPFTIGALGCAVAAVMVDQVLAGRTGQPPDLTLFLGRFHPLAVHLPIGILVLVTMAEALSLWAPARQKVDDATTIALPVLVVTGVGAFALGHLLAGGGGFPSNLLLLHRRFTLVGLIGAAVCLAVWTVYTQRKDAASRWGYRAVLGATMAVLSYGAHHGGSMTRGEGYLTKYAPEPVRKLLEGETKEADKKDEEPKPPSAEPLVFADVIMPVFKARCVECHGGEQVKGGLKMTELADMMKGGDSGPSIVPGSADKSPVYTRMMLPIDNDERMPPEGKPGPSPEELELIKWWIERGASDTMRVRDALAPEASRSVLLKTLEGAAPAGTSSEVPPAATTAGPDASAAPTEQPGASADPPPVVPAVATIPADGLVYEHLVAPVLGARCVRCHGPAKQKGKLRMDTVEAMLQGGKEGPSIIAGNPAGSSIISRTKLPLSDDKHMPPPKEPQMTAAEVALVSFWIEKGASRDLKVSAVPASLRVGAPKPPAVTPDNGHTPPAASSSAPAASSSAPVANAPPPYVPEPGPPPKPLPEELVVYRDFVRPVLMNKCGECHTEPKLSGELRVDDDAALFKGGVSGPPIVPGDPKKSLLLARVLVPMNDTDHMPPEGLAQITAEEYAVISHWIAAGAKTDMTVKSADLASELTHAFGSVFATPKPDDGAKPPDAGAKGETPPDDDDDGGHGPEPQGPPPVQGGGCASCTAGHAPDAALWPALAFLAGLTGLFARRLSSTRRRPGA